MSSPANPEFQGLSTVACGLWSSRYRQHAAKADRWLLVLLSLQWCAIVFVAGYVSVANAYDELGVSPKQTMVTSVLATFVMGGVTFLVSKRLGYAVTRHAMAIAHTIFPVLLLELAGYRAETFSPGFVSVVLLAIYGDWRVLMTAFAVATTDYILCYSFGTLMFGTEIMQEWRRSLEYLSLLTLETAALIALSNRWLREMAQLAQQQVVIREMHRDVERLVDERTAELKHSRDEVQRRNEELEQLKQRLVSQAVELEHKAVELDFARYDAEELSRIKSSFLANMSHEIRTPMTAIIGYTELLQDDIHRDCPTIRRADALAAIRRNCDHLLKIINDILDLSKIEAGKLEIEELPCDPVSIIHDVVQVLQTRAESKRLTLSVSQDNLIPNRILTDPTRLRQIMMNLVSNAIKFTDRGQVQIVLRYVDGKLPRLECDVADTGIGLTEDHKLRLFQPFSQGDCHTPRLYGGTGLGLSICKRLAELLKGDVTVVKTAIGEGTCFRVEIAAPAFVGPSSNSTSTSDNCFPVSAAMPSIPHSAEPLRGYRILLAEDGIDNQRLIKHLLSNSGATVTTVEDGHSAIARVKQAAAADQPFDIILMDIQMPLLDGCEATRTLRSLGFDTPIIALTAHAMQGDREQCLAAGCDEYVTKPIQISKLIHTIATVVSRQALEPCDTVTAS
jgi:signal transduction histidine kinase/ActR/RegA family two-component response regulator